MYQLYPRVFKSHQTQTLFVKTSVSAKCVEIKIQGMEFYTVPHTAQYRIDEETRYPFLPMQAAGGNLSAVEYAFAQEQKYSVKVRIDGEEQAQTYIYAVDEDLAACKMLKGDTHLHTNRSDGEGTPFEVGCTYRKAGFDFIAITDHHKFEPSVEGRYAFKAVTDEFTVFCGEEVHNKDMGYFHVVNFGGNASVNTPILANPEKMEARVQEILHSRDFTGACDALNCAYRIYIAEEIRKVGGLAIMAHPYWDCYGEYNAQTEDIRYLWKHGDYDALELLAGCDIVGSNGNNLQTALWADLRAEGIKIPVVGATDCHSCTGKYTRFNKQFTLVFAENADGVMDAIKAEQSVAVERRNDGEYFLFGKYRYVKYARFLLNFYSPSYDRLTHVHGEALEKGNGTRTQEIEKAEEKIAAFRESFFAF